MQKMGAVGTNTNSFDPSSDVIHEQDCDTLLLHLPGFKKDGLRVQLLGSRNLRISGTRLLANNKLVSFQKDYPVSLNCDTNNITAKFEDGLLYVRQPKQIPKTLTEEPQQLSKTPVEEPQQLSKTPVEEQLPSKKDGSEDLKAAEERNGIDGESKSGKKDVDQNSGSSTISDTDRRGKVSGDTDSSLVKERGRKTGNNVTDYNNLGVGSSVEKIRNARQMMSMILVVFLGFALGMCVNAVLWHSKKHQT